MPEERLSAAPDAPGAPRVTVAVSAAQEFAEDERMLRRATPGLRVSSFGERAVSYGVGIRPTSAYLRRAEAAGIPTARRTTGGSGVLHLVGDLAWSVVLPRSHPSVGRDFVRAYDRIGRGVVRWLSAAGVPAEWTPAPGVNPDYCVLSGRGQVLTVHGRILGGAAQHLTGVALLHQGMVARTVDRPLVGRLFGIGETSLLERLTGLEEVGITSPAEPAAHELAEELARDFPPGSG